MTFNAKINKHPDAVFGKDDADNDTLMQLVERLQHADISALTPAQQSTLSRAVAAASRRLVDDYGKLVQEREEVTRQRNELSIKALEVETREQSVNARETLLGLRPAPVKKSILTFWR
jgi:hypothetical protein